MLIMNPHTTTKNKVQKSLKLSTYYNSQNYTLLLTTLYYPGSMTLVKQVVQHQLLSYLTFARSFSIYLIVVHCSIKGKNSARSMFSLKNETKIGHYTKFLTNSWFWVVYELWKSSMCPERILQKLIDELFPPFFSPL